MATDPEDRVGQRIAGRYTLREVLGVGGAAVVYGGVRDDGGEVAVKLLHPEIARQKAIRNRFAREAKIVAALEGPCFVKVFEVGEDQEELFLVMERLRGETLAQRIDREVLLLEEAISLLSPIMLALAAAHERGLVHRDIKPDNIFLANEGDRIVPKLLDFGIAKARSEGLSTITQSGEMLGSPWYMSPEQAHGDRSLGPPSDVWSMAMVFYRAVSGVTPLRASYAIAAAFEITGDEPLRPLSEVLPGAPKSVSDVLSWALNREPSARPSMAGLERSLRALIAAQA